MKNDEARQAMVAKVQATYAKYPRFADLPEVEHGSLEFPDANLSQERYVQGLYAVCANGEVTGRRGSSLIGAQTEAEPVNPTPSMRRGGKKG